MKPASSLAMLSVSLPVSIPTPERMEEIMREEFARAADIRAEWLTPVEAAKFCNMGKTFFNTMRKNHALPRSEIGGVLSYHIDDLRRLKLLHLMTTGTAVDNAQWPSIQARNEILRNQPPTLSVAA